METQLINADRSSSWGVHESRGMYVQAINFAHQQSPRFFFALLPVSAHHILPFPPPEQRARSPPHQSNWRDGGTSERSERHGDGTATAAERVSRNGRVPGGGSAGGSPTGTHAAAAAQAQRNMGRGRDQQRRDGEEELQA